MAFPTVAAVTESSNVSITNPPVSFTQNTGDLVVIFIARPSATSISSLSNGFTALTSGAVRCNVLYKVLDGTEGGSVTVTYATSARTVAIAYNIRNHDPVFAPNISAGATGTSVNPDAPVCGTAAGAKDYLWITGFAQAGEELDDDTWVTAVPSGFGSVQMATTGISGAANTNCSVATAIQSLNTTDLDAGSFTTAQSLAWNAWTVAIHPYFTYPPAFGLKTAFKAAYKRIQQFFPLLRQYPPLPEVPGGETTVTPHFFKQPMRRYHKTGRYL